MLPALHGMTNWPETFSRLLPSSLFHHLANSRLAGSHQSLPACELRSIRCQLPQNILVPPAAAGCAAHLDGVNENFRSAASGSRFSVTKCVVCLHGSIWDGGPLPTRPGNNAIASSPTPVPSLARGLCARCDPLRRSAGIEEAMVPIITAVASRPSHHSSRFQNQSSQQSHPGVQSRHL